MKRRIHWFYVVLLSLLTLACGARRDSGGSLSAGGAEGSDKQLVAEYFAEPVHIIVPYPAGGGADVANRVIAKYLAEELGTEVVVDNAPGAGGVVALTEYLAQMPDTRSILYTNSSLLSYVPKAQKVAFGRDDFTPIISFQMLKFGLYASPEVSGIASISDLETYAAANKVIFGSPGPGKPLYASQKKIYAQMGAESDTVTPAGRKGLVNLMGDTVAVSVATVTSAEQYVADGSIVPLAVLSPDPYESKNGKIPSIYEFGYGVSNDMLTMFAIRSGSDERIVEALYQGLLKVTENPEFIAEMETIQDAVYQIMDGDGIRDFLDEMDLVSDMLIAQE